MRQVLLGFFIRQFSVEESLQVLYSLLIRPCRDKVVISVVQFVYQEILGKAIERESLFSSLIVDFAQLA